MRRATSAGMGERSTPVQLLDRILAVDKRGGQVSFCLGTEHQACQ